MRKLFADFHGFYLCCSILHSFISVNNFVCRSHTQLKIPRGKGVRPRAIPVGARNWPSRKRRDSRAKRGRNVRFRDSNAARDRCLSRGCWSGRSAGADSGHGIYAPKKNTPNRSLVAHIITYMSHTSAIERIFQSIYILFRDHAHNRVHFGRRPESAAIVSFATRKF